MSKRKFRTLKELYAVTQEVSDSKIIQVSNGGYDTQEGPSDHANDVVQMDMGLSGIEGRFSRNFPSGIFHTRAESRTCNVCATWCTSCMHINQVPLVSDEHSNEASQGNKSSSCSLGDADLVCFKRTSGNDKQYTSNETSNIVSAYSSHGSFSGRAESKATLNVSDTLEDIGMLAKISTAQTVPENLGLPNLHLLHGKVCSNKLKRQKVLECGGDDVSYPSQISSLRDVYPGAASSKGGNSEGSSEQVESSLEKLDNFGAGACQYNAHDCAESVKPDKKMDTDNLAVEAINCIYQNVDFGKLKVSFEASNLHEPSSQPRSVAKSGGSDTVDVEVKNCEICGDAGQEKLLAICSKCTDGAEHIYCMKVKLEKVPEGEWMCEECRLIDKSEREKRDDFEEAIGTSNRPSLLELSKKSRKACIFYYGKNKVSSIRHFPAKRPAVNLEYAFLKKRSPLKTSVGSEKASSHCGQAVLCQDSSLRDLNEGKVDLGHHKSFLGDQSAVILDLANTPFLSVHNASNSQLRLRTLQDSLLKSNSFDAVKLMTKVQHPEKDVLQEQKFDRVVAAESTIKAMTKSMSFSGTSEDHSNARISKVKMVSTGLSGAEDQRNLQSSKDQNLMQRDHSVNSDSLMMSSHVVGSHVSASKTGKKACSSHDSVFSVPSQANCRHFKAASFHQTDNLSKPMRSCYDDGSGNPTVLAGSDALERLPSCSFDSVKDLYDLRKSDSSHELNLNQVSIGNIKGVAVATGSRRRECVPELQYSWRGGFDMKRSRKLPRICDGIQAHISTCASPKVNEIVKKFHQKVILEEVSRFSTWPTQFLKTGVTEDNIALYFFAEDLQSYESNYKILLECMIENDIALKGYIDGIELLIFPSNLLPEKSQSWNRLSFLWGVFRVRRVRIGKINCVPNLNIVPSDHDMEGTTTSVKGQIDPEGQQGLGCKPHLEGTRVSDMECVTVEEELAYKRMRKCLRGDCLSGDRSNLSECNSSGKNAVGNSFSVNFPQRQSLDSESQMESRIPNLELSLGPKNKMEDHGVLSPFLGMLNKKNNQDKHSNPAAVCNSDGVSASLVLSLACPFSDKENVFKSV